MRRLLNWSFLKDRRGGVMIEAAVTMPFLIFIMLGGVEVVRFALLQQKLSRAAVSMADLVAQAETLTTGEVDQLFAAVSYVTSPFQLGTNGRVFVSSVSKTGTNPPRVDWQRSGAGTASVTSSVGTAGSDATLPSGFIVRAGESVIYAEVIYQFEPFLFSQVVSPQQLRHQAFFRPRFGALTSLPSS